MQVEPATQAVHPVHVCPAHCAYLGDRQPVDVGVALVVGFVLLEIGFVVLVLVLGLVVLVLVLGLVVVVVPVEPLPMAVVMGPCSM